MTASVSPPASAARRYVRLTPATWAEIDALWRTGEPTLAELSHKYGPTERALQAHFAKHGVEKGSAARALAATVEARVLEEVMIGEDVLVQRSKDIRESAYANALKIETMIVARLEAAATDPAATFAVAASIKMLGVAAQALERLHGLKRAALGLTNDDALSDDIPVLQIEDLSEADIKAMREEQEEDDAPMIDASEDVIETA